MTIERALRALAGAIVLVSVALGYYVHPAFFLLTAFVGANLLQSAFTNACPAMAVFRRLGLRSCVPAGLALNEPGHSGAAPAVPKSQA